MENPTDLKAIPTTLYKYCGPSGFDIFKNSRLKITPPDQFSDPFEFAPAMVANLPMELAASLAGDPDVQRGAYETATREGIFTGSFSQFVKSLESRGGTVAAARGSVEWYPQAATTFRDTLLREVSRFCGILCLSETRDDILMWAHYTRGHTGFAVGLDTACLSFSAARRSPMPVKYADERVLMRPYVNTADPELDDAVTSLVLRKSKQWDHEREWRQVHYLSRCETHEPAKDESGRIEHFKNIEPKAITEVIFGCRCNEDEALELLQDKAFSNVKVRKARLHDTLFELV